MQSHRTCLPPKWGHWGKRLRSYGERVTRLTTPFNDFIDDLSAWIDSAWFVWIALGITIALVIVIVAVTKVRARARARVPQYRRRES